MFDRKEPFIKTVSYCVFARPELMQSPQFMLSQTKLLFLQ